MPDAPVVYVDVIEEEPLTEEEFAEVQDRRRTPPSNVAAEYQKYLEKFQPWRTVVRSGGNQKTMFRSSERYFNEADARHAAEVCFSAATTVFLRQQEHGNVLLRQGVKA